MALYAATIFLSAFLLFLVQPLIGKYILPWFGGSPAVWTTCMLFFQVLLLGGYSFAHLLNRLLRPRAQAVAYLAALVGAALLLPITPDAAWKPVDAGNPTVRILLLLLVSIGGPYFLLSTTGPLLQAWFSRVNPARSPYRLYALSNLGSFVALLGYPVLVEPSLSRPEQGRLWSIAFVGYGLLGAAVAWGIWRRGLEIESATTPRVPPSGADTRPASPFRHRLLWTCLSACGVVLLLATTNELSQDVAVVPFLWVLPLSLYLLSFVVCFGGRGWYARSLLALGMIELLWLVYQTIAQGAFADIKAQATIFPVAMFVGCLLCHGELYRLRPRASDLTGFYLAMALGGAVGGLFVAVAAPALFDAFYELPVGFAACGLLVLWSSYEDDGTELGVIARIVARVLDLGAEDRARLSRMLHGISRGAATVFAVGSVAFGYYAVPLRPGTGGVQPDATLVEASRNFYGLLGVLQHGPPGQSASYRELKHGRIAHGVQFDDVAKKSWGTGYYGPNGGGGLVMRLAHAGQARRIGIVGLGIGTQATYGTLLDKIRFYEINPEVERLARTRFTYLADSRAAVEVVLGDARRSMEREEPQNYDIIVLDAFSGDAIPVHLLTREAFDTYLRHLKSDGVIAVHISNRHLDLRPVVWKLADAIRLNAVVIATEEDDHYGVGPATWMLLTADNGFLGREEIRRAADKDAGRRDGIAMWTDDWTNLFQLIRWPGRE